MLDGLQILTAVSKGSFDPRAEGWLAVRSVAISAALTRQTIALPAREAMSPAKLEVSTPSPLQRQ
jgi:hypothetical protein